MPQSCSQMLRMLSSSEDPRPERANPNSEGGQVRERNGHALPYLSTPTEFPKIMRAAHALSRIALALIGAGLLITLVFSVVLRCIEPRLETLPEPVSVQAIHTVYRPLGMFLCALGAIVVLAITVMTDDEDG